MRSNKRGDGKAAHIVSAWSKEDGFCLGQKAVEEKSKFAYIVFSNTVKKHFGTFSVGVLKSFPAGTLKKHCT